MTGSAATLDDLITMVRSDNNRRQQEVDRIGFVGLAGAVPRRTLDVSVLSGQREPVRYTDLL